METNLNKIAKDLYGKIQTRFPDIKIGDENAVVLSKKQDIPQARFFEFNYTEGGDRLGTIVITLDAEDGIVVQVSGDLADNEHFHSSAGPLAFIRSFRKFAKDHLLKFDVQNIGKSNLDKRDYEFQTKKPSNGIFESKLSGSDRKSYQKIGSAKLVIKHSSPINLESVHARTSKISAIFIENSQGERFKYPYKHVNGARALAEHVSNGGNPYDQIGQYIVGLSEELGHLRKFKNYVNRTDTLSESEVQVVGKVVERIESIKKEITQLQRPKSYKKFAENFVAANKETIPEQFVSEWVDLLTVRSFNEDIRNSLSYIYPLLKDFNEQVKTLSPEDLLKEDTVENTLFSPNKKVQDNAIKQLKQLFADTLENGPDATNSLLSIKGLIDNHELDNKLKQLDPSSDARPTISEFIKQIDPELARQLTAAEEPVAECSNDAATNISPIDSILKSIAGFWNAAEKNFTIGGTKVKIKVVKNFKDGAYPDASEHDVNRALKIIEKMDPSNQVTVNDDTSDLDHIKALVSRITK